MSRRVLGTVLEIAVPAGAARAVGGAGRRARETYYFPPLTDILETFADTWLFERVGSDVVPSLVRLGARLRHRVRRWPSALGLALGLSRRLRRALDPSCSSCARSRRRRCCRSAILVLGVGTSMKVFIIAFVCLWPVLLNTIDGVAGVDPTLRETADVLRHRPRATGVLRVILPAAAPQIFAGMRTSLSLALILMVISEMVASTQRHRLLRAAVPAQLRDPRDVVRDPAAGHPRVRAERRLPAGRAARAAVAPRRARERAELMGDPMLHVEHLKKRYGDVEAIGDLSFDVARRRVRLRRRARPAAARRRC